MWHLLAGSDPASPLLLPALLSLLSLLSCRHPLHSEFAMGECNSLLQHSGCTVVWLLMCVGDRCRLESKRIHLAVDSALQDTSYSISVAGLQVSNSPPLPISMLALTLATWRLSLMCRPAGVGAAEG